MGHPVWEREGATAAIGAALDQARAGEGGVLFLVAEAGLGKTTMVDRARQLAGSAFAVGAGHGDATEATLPFGIFSQALDDLGSQGAIEPETGPAVFGSDARAARYYGVLRFLQRSSVEPVLLLLDDLHWADPDSLGLLSFLAKRIGALPVAMIGTLRPWPPNAIEMAQRLATSGDARLERLTPLSEAATGALLTERLGDPVPTDQVIRARSLTSGNPLLLEQVAREMVRGKDVLNPLQGAATFEADLLLTRFAGGSASERRYAEAAAIFGTTFPPGLAAELAGLPNRDAEEALDGLFASGVVRATDDGLAEFAHPLLRQTLYDRMPAPVRSGKHASAFRALLARGVDPAEAAEHAMRADLAGDPQAIAVLERAGRQALDAGALASARQRFEAAVTLAGTRASSDVLLTLAGVLLATADAPATAAICRRLLAMDALADRDRMAARRLLGRARFVGGDPQGALAEFQQAVSDSPPTDPSESVETLLEAVYVSWPTVGPALATPLAARAKALAHDVTDDLRIRAETAWAFSAFVGGDPGGIEVIEEAARRAEADPVSDIGNFAWTWGAIGLHGNVAKWMERYDEAERAFRVGMATAERLNLPVAIASLAVMHADTCARTGRLEEGLRLLDRASALSDLAPERAFWAAIAHSYILIEMGRVDEARSWTETARSLANPIDGWPGSLWLWHVDAQLALQDRRREAACALFEKIEALADRTGILEPCVVPWMGDAMGAYVVTHRSSDASRIFERLQTSIGRLPCRSPRVVVALAMATQLDAMGDQPGAENAYSEARALSREVPSPPLQARVLLRYGVYLRRRGERVAARKPFAEALELAELVGAEIIVARAAEELAAVGGRHRRRHENPDALTGAEARVASLAYEGMSDREIAQRLNNSVHTVETHLQHVYRKLGIKSRRDLMRRPPPWGP
ncbi:MAG: AAA family ATPase [Candidatus Dormibacteraeota bacterium]|nr:AAA family ATPase [Candidatus Dormibacteraeota bacterium]